MSTIQASRPQPSVQNAVDDLARRLNVSFPLGRITQAARAQGKETGTHFISRAVLNLLSPPLTPQYNDSIEASAGQLKTRAALLAQLSSCDTWTSDILEAARLKANAQSRPWGPAAESRWTIDSFAMAIQADGK